MNNNKGDDGSSGAELLRLSADIVAAYVGQNNVGVSAVPDLIGQVHRTLSLLGREPAVPAERQKPAVPVCRYRRFNFPIGLPERQENNGSLSHGR